MRNVSELNFSGYPENLWFLVELSERNQRDICVCIYNHVIA